MGEKFVIGVSDVCLCSEHGSACMEDLARDIQHSGFDIYFSDVTDIEIDRPRTLARWHFCENG